MQAVDPGAVRVDEELAVDGEPVSNLDRNPRAQLRVVVELQLVTQSIARLYSLVAAGICGRTNHCADECDLRPRTPQPFLQVPGR